MLQIQPQPNTRGVQAEYGEKRRFVFDNGKHLVSTV